MIFQVATRLAGFLWLSSCAELSAQASCQTGTSSSDCEILQALGLDDDDSTALELLQVAKLQVRESSAIVGASGPAAQRSPAGTTAGYQVKGSSALEAVLSFANQNPLLLYALAGGSAFCVGMILLCILKRGDGSVSPKLRQPSILQISSDGERACGTSICMKSLQNQYSFFFEPKTFSKLGDATSAKLTPSMGNSFHPVRQSMLDLGSKTSLHTAKLVEIN